MTYTQTLFFVLIYEILTIFCFIVILFSDGDMTITCTETGWKQAQNPGQCVPSMIFFFVYINKVDETHESICTCIFCFELKCKKFAKIPKKTK